MGKMLTHQILQLTVEIVKARVQSVSDIPIEETNEDIIDLIDKVYNKLIELNKED